MTRKEYLRYLFRSPFGFVLMVLSLLAGFFGGIKLGFLAAFASGFGMFAFVFILASVSGLGSRLAVKEQEDGRWVETKKALLKTKDARKKLASLRFPDPDVQELLQLAAMKGLSYLSACESAKTREPRACNALSECLEISDMYLHELDGSSTEKRFNIADQDPFLDAKHRTLNALKERIRIIDEAITLLRGGLPSMRMEIKETL